MARAAAKEADLRFGQPSREAGLQRLQAFLPYAGRDYAQSRNYDLGPGRHSNVSCLSPYLRHRLVSEDEVIRAVVERHGLRVPEKFLQEVFWRTYWKGWLERRPTVWTDYCAERDAIRARLSADAALSDAVQRAQTGDTGIACFDAWVRELNETGYLHNHARMWTASIWIFTLRLPWSLGADLFMQRLLDGDPASNTLSWRWVAGLQTVGKTYLARPDNIATFTNGRFAETGELAMQAHPLEGSPPPPAMAPPVKEYVCVAPNTALLILDDDVAADDLAERLQPVAITGVNCAAFRSPNGVSASVGAFAQHAVNDSLARLADAGYRTLPCVPAEADCEKRIVDWAVDVGAKRVVMRYAPVGPGRSFVRSLRVALSGNGIDLAEDLRGFDARAWAFADKGFFPFKKHIPHLIEQLD